MLIESIVNLAREYLLTGVILVLAVVALFIVYRVTIGKRGDKEHKKINWKRLIWWFVFLCYIFMVFSATMFNRTDMHDNEFIRPLFYSYKAAWNGWIESEWRNIILNYILFVPFGILLPAGVKFFRKFYKVALAGFTFSLFIEITQKIFSLGYFEFDDLMDNTLGAVIGYGLFMVGYGIFVKVTGGERVKPLNILLANIPLAVAGCAFFTVLFLYESKELGNNNNHYIVQYPEKLLTFSGAEFTDDSAKTLPVYRCENITKEEAVEIADKVFQRFGKGEGFGLTNYYEDTANFWSKERNAVIWVKYHGGTYEFIDLNNSANNAVAFDEEDVRDILRSYGYSIVDVSRFVEGQNYEYSLKFDMREYEGYVWSGRIDVQLCADRTVKTLKYSAYPLTFYKEFEVKTQAEAFKELKEGKFKRFENEPLNIEVIRCHIDYSFDSKGFYQPNYRFYSLVNGEEAWIMIPAIK